MEPAGGITILRRHRLILVRHAPPAIDPAREPAEWGLAEAGRIEARRLIGLGVFDRAVAFYSGPEPKMVETLSPVASAHDRRVEVEPAFAETHSAGWQPDRAAFEAVVRRLFDQPDAPPASGWESGAAARARFERAIARLRAEHEPPANRDRVLPATVAICSGGRMLVTYLAGALAWPAEAAFDAWRSLRMPDLAVVEINEADAARIVIPFGRLVVPAPGVMAIDELRIAPVRDR